MHHECIPNEKSYYSGFTFLSYDNHQNYFQFYLADLSKILHSCYSKLGNQKICKFLMILFYNYGEDLGHLDDNGDLDEEDDQ